MAAISSWTPERVEMLREIWPKGYSATEAAAILGGTTRCAVIGKVHRLGLPVRLKDSGARCVDPVVQAQRAEKTRQRDTHNKRVRRAVLRGASAPDSAPSREMPATPSYAGSRRLQFVDLASGQCLFPEGDEPPFAFCGNPVAGGSSWCNHHQRVVYQPPERRRAARYMGNRSGRKVSNYVGSHEPA